MLWLFIKNQNIRRRWRNSPPLAMSPQHPHKHLTLVKGNLLGKYLDDVTTICLCSMSLLRLPPTILWFITILCVIIPCMVGMNLCLIFTIITLENSSGQLLCLRCSKSYVHVWPGGYWWVEEDHFLQDDPEAQLSSSAKWSLHRVYGNVPKAKKRIIDREYFTI